MNVRHLASGVAAWALLCASAAFAANAAPTITTFSVPTSAVSPVPINAFAATDSDGTVAGYMITTTSTKPSGTAAGWSATRPTNFTTGTIGSQTLYAWAKDNLNAVSNSVAKTLTVVGSHLHAMADVTGLTAALAAKADTAAVNQALAGKADVSHNHDTAYERNYAQVVTVSPTFGEAEFTNPAVAVASITDASAEKPYLVKIMPGVYNLASEDFLLMKAYVDVEGSGREVTRIKGGGASSNPAAPTAVVRGAAGVIAELRKLTVESTTPQWEAVCDPYRLTDVSLISAGKGAFPICLMT